jgi:membrane-associated phospholipid phosphatase
MRFPRRALGAGLALGLVVTPAWAARSEPDPNRPYWRTNLFKRVATDQKFLLTRWVPHEFKEPQFVCALGAGLAIAIQSGSRENGAGDVGLQNGIVNASGPVATSTARVFAAMGEVAVAASLIGITYLSARRAHNDRLSEASSLAAESFVDAGIWVTVLKAAAARVRPEYDNANRFFQYGAAQNNSFPSGHAMCSFSVAAVFAGVYKEKKWVPWLSYGLATMISASRVVLGRHYPGDVIVGGVLGASIGRGVIFRNGEETARRQGTVVPVVGPGGRGVGVGWSYSWK